MIVRMIYGGVGGRGTVRFYSYREKFIDVKNGVVDCFFRGWVWFKRFFLYIFI